MSKIIDYGWFLSSLLSKIPGRLMKVALVMAKKYFRSIRNNSCCLKNWLRNLKENTLFWNNFSFNFKMKKRIIWWKLFKLLKILTFYWKELPKKINKKTKDQKLGFLGTLLGILGPILLGNMLIGKYVNRKRNVKWLWK